MSGAESSADAEPIGEREWRLLVGAAAHGRFPCRDRALLHLFWDHGATPRQVLELEAGHVDFLAGTLRWPDGGRARLAPETRTLLAAYVSMERHPRCPKLFGGRHGLPLRPADLDRLFRRVSALAGVQADPRSLHRAALLRLLRAAPLLALTLRPRRRAAPAP